MQQSFGSVGTVLMGIAALATGLGSEAVADGSGAPTGEAWSAQTSEAGAASGSGRPRPDLSGRERVGIASFYGREFFGRQMADGAIMDPHGTNAASRTLPLGTTARVTNLQSGRSAIVVIEDRGPYVKGRIVDLSPSTARKIGITRRMGLAKVAVAPIEVPLPDGRIRLGAASRESASNRF